MLKCIPHVHTLSNVLLSCTRRRLYHALCFVCRGEKGHLHSGTDQHKNWSSGLSGGADTGSDTKRVTLSSWHIYSRKKMTEQIEPEKRPFVHIRNYIKAKNWKKISELACIVKVHKGF